MGVSLASMPSFAAHLPTSSSFEGCPAYSFWGWILLACIFVPHSFFLTTFPSPLPPRALHHHELPPLSVTLFPPASQCRRVLFVSAVLRILFETPHFRQPGIPPTRTSGFLGISITRIRTPIDMCLSATFSHNFGSILSQCSPYH